MLAANLYFNDFKAVKPTDKREYLCFTHAGMFMLLQFDVEHGVFNYLYDEETGKEDYIKVHMWADVKDTTEDIYRYLDCSEDKV